MHNDVVIGANSSAKLSICDQWGGFSERVRSERLTGLLTRARMGPLAVLACQRWLESSQTFGWINCHSQVHRVPGFRIQPGMSWGGAHMRIVFKSISIDY